MLTNIAEYTCYLIMISCIYLMWFGTSGVLR